MSVEKSKKNSNNIRRNSNNARKNSNNDHRSKKKWKTKNRLTPSQKKELQERKLKSLLNSTDSNDPKKQAFIIGLKNAEKFHPDPENSNKDSESSTKDPDPVNISQEPLNNSELPNSDKKTQNDNKNPRNENRKKKKLEENKEVEKGPQAKKIKTVNVANNVPWIKASEKVHDVIYTEEERAKLRTALRQRNAEKMSRPNVKLTELGIKSTLDRPENSRIPLFLSDFQHFMMYSQLSHYAIGNIPTWIKIDRRQKVDRYMFLIIEGVSLLDYVGCEEECPTLNMFSIKIDTITPLSYGGNLTDEVSTVPLTRSQLDKMVHKYGSLKNASQDKSVVQVLRTIYPFKDFQTGASKLLAPVKKDQAFPRTELLLTPWQMIEEGYPLPVQEDLDKYKGFVYTKESYQEVSEKSPMMGLDVEMCRTTAGMEVTRLSVVDENHEVFYTSFVLPYNRIVDYVTQFSGITPELLRNVTTRLDDVHAYLRKNLPPDVILVGHSLNFDLVALKLFHPYVIDTSVCFNVSGIKHRKSKLRYLVAEFLSEKIQEGHDGHDPTEDALSSLKLVQAKLKRNIGWGNALISGVRPAEESLASHLLLMQRDQQKNNQETKPSKEINTFTFERKVKAKSDCMASFASLFLGNLFRNMTQKEHKLLLIARTEETTTYRNFIPRDMNVDEPECPFQIKTCRTNKEVIKHGKYHAIDHGTTLMHIKINDCRKAEKLVKKLLLNITDGEDKHKNILVGVFLAGKNPEGVAPANNHGLFLVNMFRSYLPSIEDYLAKIP